MRKTLTAATAATAALLLAVAPTATANPTPEPTPYTFTMTTTSATPPFKLEHNHGGGYIPETHPDYQEIKNTIGNKHAEFIHDNLTEHGFLLDVTYWFYEDFTDYHSTGVEVRQRWKLDAGTLTYTENIPGDVPFVAETAITNISDLVRVTGAKELTFTLPRYNSERFSTLPPQYTHVGHDTTDLLVLGVKSGTWFDNLVAYSGLTPLHITAGDDIFTFAPPQVGANEYHVMYADPKPPTQADNQPDLPTAPAPEQEPAPTPEPTPEPDQDTSAQSLTRENPQPKAKPQEVEAPPAKPVKANPTVTG